MFTLRSKYCMALLPALLLTASSLIAGEDKENCNKKDSTNSNRFYIGGFGGELFSNTAHVSQMGTALFQTVEGPLAVEARGYTKKASPGFGGVQLGYEWSKRIDKCRHWALAPGAEMEGYWYSRHVKGHLMNATDTDRLPEHDFLDTFHMNAGVYLANFVLSLNNTWKLSPYVAAGVGASRMSLRNAKSLQVAPKEPGINHFNSRTHDSSWAFAAQIKAGLRYKLRWFHVFGEYRYLFVDFSNYIFGSTVYPTHAHTTPWNVKFQNIQYNGFAFGVQFDL
ncbi:MAG: hypothetical protein K2P51_05565 [Rhabdochlamydiaceae bacterium]|nr:hypothetical protein [Rhabdochlamydiaceae bacterium]